MLVVTLIFQRELKSLVKKSFFPSLIINFVLFIITEVCFLSALLNLYDNLLIHTLSLCQLLSVGRHLFQSIPAGLGKGSDVSSHPKTIGSREHAWRDLVTLIKAANIFAMKTLQPHTKHSCTSYCNPSWSCSTGSFPVQGPVLLLHFTVLQDKVSTRWGDSLPSHSSPSNQKSSKTEVKLLK